jgi:hypothetical protein
MIVSFTVYLRWLIIKQYFTAQTIVNIFLAVGLLPRYFIHLFCDTIFCFYKKCYLCIPTPKHTGSGQLCWADKRQHGRGSELRLAVCDFHRRGGPTRHDFRRPNHRVPRRELWAQLWFARCSVAGTFFSVVLYIYAL